MRSDAQGWGLRSELICAIDDRTLRIGRLCGGSDTKARNVSKSATQTNEIGGEIGGINDLWLMDTNKSRDTGSDGGITPQAEMEGGNGGDYRPAVALR